MVPPTTIASFVRLPAWPAGQPCAAPGGNRRPCFAPTSAAGPPRGLVPDCSTTMRSKLRKLDSRCAIAITVRPHIRRSSACRTASSDSPIERRGRLIEQQNWCVLQKRARNADALALSGRQLDAAVANDRRKPFGQIIDEIPAIGRLDGVEHIGIGRIRPAVADVLHDRSMKQRDVLRHDSDRSRRLSWVTRAISWPPIRMRPLCTS